MPFINVQGMQINAGGTVAERLMRAKGNPEFCRPWLGEDNRAYITLNAGTDKEQTYLTNANALLRRDQWLQMDREVQMAALVELDLWTDLRAAVTTDIPNAMAHSVLGYQRSDRVGTATTSMDGMRQTNRARPNFDTIYIPNPITHEDFDFSLRDTLQSENSFGAIGLDGQMIRNAGRNIGERLEGIAIGTTTGMTFGGGTIYGITNFPYRLTGSVVTPTGSNGPAVLANLAAMIQALKVIYQKGPFVLYFGTSWDQFLGQDFSTAKGDNTLGERILKLPRVSRYKVLEGLSGYQVVAVALDKNTIEAMNGMEINTIQWEEHGGMKLCWKTLCIQWPRIRADRNNSTGICHYS